MATYHVSFLNSATGWHHSTHAVEAASPDTAEKRARENLNREVQPLLDEKHQNYQDYAASFRAVVTDENGQPPGASRSQQEG